VRSIQYPIVLPNGYDMSLIGQRARTKAPLFDSLPGLELKAFLTASTDDGAPQNLYLPFYVWEDSLAIARFLGGPLFGAVIDSFGRPPVLDRQVLEFGVADRDVVPSLATFETMSADRAARPPEIWRWERWAQRQALELPGLFAACSTIDTVSWMVTRVRFWASASAVRGISRDAARMRVAGLAGRAVRTHAGAFPV
jgi:hypothetical protein